MLQSSQSVDLIKPKEQMGDSEDSKSFQTKSSNALEVGLNREAYAGQFKKDGSDGHVARGNVSSSTGKKGSNQKEQDRGRKKSNNSSKSRGKHSEGSSDDAQAAILVKQFIESLVDKACDIGATDEEQKLRDASLASKRNQSESKAQVKEKGSSVEKLGKAAEVEEDLGSILTRKKSKM